MLFPGPALGSALVSNLSSKYSSLCASFTSPRRPHLPLHLVPSPHGSLTRPLGERTRELTAKYGGVGTAGKNNFHYL